VEKCFSNYDPSAVKAGEVMRMEKDLGKGGRVLEGRLLL